MPESISNLKKDMGIGSDVSLGLLVPSSLGSTETLLILLKGKSDTCLGELAEISLKMLRLGAE